MVPSARLLVFFPLASGGHIAADSLTFLPLFRKWFRLLVCWCITWHLAAILPPTLLPSSPCTGNGSVCSSACVSRGFWRPHIDSDSLTFLPLFRKWFHLHACLSITWLPWWSYCLQFIHLPPPLFRKWFCLRICWSITCQLVAVLPLIHSPSFPSVQEMVPSARLPVYHVSTWWPYWLWFTHLPPPMFRKWFRLLVCWSTTWPLAAILLPTLWPSQWFQRRANR